jgi:hypothetical protein
MNGRWLMRRRMGVINTPQGEDEGGMLMPPAHSPLATGAKRPQARCTALVAAKFVINRSHGDGSPAFGAEVNSTQEKPLVFTYLDPEKKGRSIGQQVDDYIAVIERQAAEELEQSAS